MLIIKYLYLSNFNTNNVNNMRYMFYGCSSLKNLNILNFNSNNVTGMSFMLFGFSNDFKMKIIKKNKDIKDEAFD